VTRYVLAHGFGFSNDYWNNLAPLLDGYVHYLGDLDIDSDLEFIGIGHSLGFLKLNNSSLKFKRLIGLQGFLNYCGDSGRLRRIIEPKLDELIARFTKDSRSGLREFREACGYTNASHNSQPHEYMADLMIMKNRYIHCGARTTIIGTETDVIVPKLLIMDNFQDLQNVDIRILNIPVNHTLGFHNPEAVIELIRGA
jgi:pimeloyl-[acyl-carrier protein] methyl ester esterase